jgi:uncharacterized peroxidase-related enzyme
MYLRVYAIVHEYLNQRSNPMPRILPATPDQIDDKTTASLKAVQARFGMFPNQFTTLARAPAALKGYLQISDALAQGRLSARQRELIAIAVAQENTCTYCLSAHTAIGKRVGLNRDDIGQARVGGSMGTKDGLVTKLAIRIVKSHANITDSEFVTAHKAGLDDGLILEIIAHVALNVLTNYVNRIAETDVDFPVVDQSLAI